jgi:diacylglycerol kinase (ATP)
MRAAVIFGLDSHRKDLKLFQDSSDASWVIGLPASCSEADAILVFGGDGTVHRHLAQLVRLRLPVLVVPCGSGNDFARALNLNSRRDSVAAWREFASGAGKVRTIDLGIINGHYFCCVGGVGLDGEVTRRANRLPRWLRGHGGYVVSLPPALFRFAPLAMKISLPDGERSGHFVLAAFANTPVFGGGMKIAPQALIDDGQLDVCVISDINKFKLFCLFPTVYFGKHLSMQEVQYSRTTSLRLETETPLDVYADGEFVCQTPIDVGVAPGALRVIVS